jgi:hypothetical protein
VFETHLALTLVEIAVVEFDDSAAPGAHHVVVALAGSHALVDIVLPSKTGLAGQAALDQEVEGAVDRRARDSLSLVAELEEKGVGVEVTARVEELFEEHESLLGHLEVVVTKVLYEEFLRSLHRGLRCSVSISPELHAKRF